MFGKRTILYVVIGNHPIETTIKNWLFGVPGVKSFASWWFQPNWIISPRVKIKHVLNHHLVQVEVQAPQGFSQISIKPGNDGSGFDGSKVVCPSPVVNGVIILQVIYITPLNGRKNAWVSVSLGVISMEFPWSYFNPVIAGISFTL